MSLPSAYQRWLTRCWVCLAYLVIAMAVLLTGLRLAAPWLGDYRAVLADRIEQRIDAPVSIGGLGVEWRLLGPGLEFVDVHVGGERDDALHFDRARLGLRLAWLGAGDWPLRIEDLELIGLDVSLRLDEDGRLHWRGFSWGPVTGGGDGPRATSTRGRQRPLAWMRSVDELRLHDVHIEVARADGGRRVLADSDLRLVNEGSRTRFAIETGLAESGPDARLNMRAMLTAPADTARLGRWRLYIDAQGIDLARWLSFWPTTAAAVTDGRIDAEAWLRGRSTRLEHALIDGEARSVRWAGSGDRDPVAVSRLEGRWGWRRTPAGWRVAGERVVVERGGRAWPETAMRVERFAPADGEAGWRGRVGFLDLADAVAVARMLPLPQEAAAQLQALRPRGRVEGLGFHWRGPAAFALRASVDELAWAPSSNFPGAEGVDGWLRLDAEGGVVGLRTAGAAVRMPALFRKPLPVAHASGRIRWRRQPGGGLGLTSDKLVVANGDVTTRSTLALAVPADQAASIDLRVDFADGDIAAVPRYLPAHVMDPEAVAWLDRALRGGRVNEGSLVWRGPVEAFPYRDGGGRFTVDFSVAGGDVRFDPEWPALKHMDGRVHFDRARMTMEGVDGRFGGGDIAAFELYWPELERPWLAVDAEGVLAMPEAIALATQTPLREALGEAFGGATGSGRVALGLHLELPIERPEQARARGRFRLDEVTLTQPRFGIELSQLRGGGRFHDDAITIEGMRARQRGRPVSIEARPQPGREPRVRFRVSGRLSPDELLPRDAEALRALGRGRSHWQVAVSIPTGDDAERRSVVLDARSDLDGTAVALPSPLAKSRAGARRLDVRMRLGGGPGARQRAWFNYDDRVRGVLALDTGEDTLRTDRATFRFGGGNPQLVDATGLVLTGRLPALPLRPWLRWLLRDNAEVEQPGLRLTRAELTLDAVSFGGHRAREITADAERDGDTVVIQLASDAIQGRLEVPTASAQPNTIRARLQRLDYGGIRPDELIADDAAPAAGERVDPTAFPAWDVRIERLMLRRGVLEQARLVTRPSGSVHRIHRLGFDAPGVRMRAQGAWTARGSRLHVVVDGDDFGRGLAQFGYGAVMERGTGRVTADLQWAGPPWGPALAETGGQARLELRDGQLRQLDVGPARLLGLFSLDLAGVVRSGFDFDQLAGRVDLEQGDAFVRGIEIVGSPGRIVIDGRVGLVARDYDQTIVFQPELSGSLTVIGAVSGGAAGGALGALVEGVLRGMGVDLGDATAMRYRLTGSWADPKVQQIQPTGDSGAGSESGSDPGVRERRGR
jgi:uncharacterized protein (TIGR02099 family)